MPFLSPSLSQVITQAGQTLMHLGSPPQASQVSLILGTGISGIPSISICIFERDGSNTFSLPPEQASSHSRHPTHLSGITLIRLIFFLNTPWGQVSLHS